MNKHALLLSVTLSLIVTFLYLIMWAMLSKYGTFNPIDFLVFYSGASIVRDGFGSRIYDAILQSQYQLGFSNVFSFSEQHPLPFISPPHLAIVFLPLTLLSPLHASFFWIALQTIIVSITIFLYLGKKSRFSLSERIIHLGIFVSFPMLFATIYKGQLTLIIFLCIFFWIKEIRQGNDKGVAFWLLVGSIKPQLIIVPLLVTFLARRWKALIYFLVGGLGICIVSSILLGPEIIPDFLISMLKMESHWVRKYGVIYMYNMKGFLSLNFGLGMYPLISILSLVGYILALCMIILLWRGRINISDKQFEIKLALSLLLGILFCPHLFYYDTLLLVVVAKLFYNYLVKLNLKYAHWLFLLIMYLIPILFIGNTFSIAGYIFRWSFLLMILWTFAIVFTIFYGSQKTESLTPS